MIGIYLNEVECDSLIPLLIRKINELYSFSPLDERQSCDIRFYQEILARIYSAKNMGVLNVDGYGNKNL